MTPTIVPVYDISSVPTGANLGVSDLTSASNFLGYQGRQANVPPATVPLVEPCSVAPSQLFSSRLVSFPPEIPSSVSQATVVAPQLGLSIQSEIDHLSRLGAGPPSLVSRVPVMSGLGTTNVVSACPAIPTVGISSIHSGLAINPGGMGPQHYPGLAPGVQSASFSTSVPGFTSSYGVTSSAELPQSISVPGYGVNVSSASGFHIGQNSVPGLPRVYNSASQYQVVPTQYQLMARQVISRKTGHFSTART